MSDYHQEQSMPTALAIHSGDILKTEFREALGQSS
jgi:hypothetical protein